MRIKLFIVLLFAAVAAYSQESFRASITANKTYLALYVLDSYFDKNPEKISQVISEIWNSKDASKNSGWVLLLNTNSTAHYYVYWVTSEQITYRNTSNNIAKWYSILDNSKEVIIDNTDLDFTDFADKSKVISDTITNSTLSVTLD